LLSADIARFVFDSRTGGARRFCVRLQRARLRVASDPDVSRLATLFSRLRGVLIAQGTLEPYVPWRPRYCTSLTVW